MRDCSDSGEEQIVLEPEDVKVTAEFIKKDNDVSMQGQCRQFVFAEFLAGMGGLSEAEVHIRREDFHLGNIGRICWGVERFGKQKSTKPQQAYVPLRSTTDTSRLHVEL